MNLAILSWKNLWARPWATLISLLLLVLGVAIISLLLQLDNQLDDKFKRNIRGIDMVVGAKGSPLQLILSSVYHIDNPTGNIPLAEARTLRSNPLIEKWIPMAYGDNYQGYRILGTTWNYPEHYGASLAEGRRWKAPFETVMGATAAKRLGLKVGDSFLGAHGSVAEAEVHEDHPYKVVGILSETETVVDQLILTSVRSVWDVHNHDHEHEKEQDDPANHDDHDHDHADHDHDHADHDHDHDHADHDHDHADHDHSDPDQELLEEADRDITAVLLKWKNPMAMMQLPRYINQETSMQAAVTAIEINRLFDLFAVGFATLRGIAWAIVLISGLSVFFSLYNSLRGRSYELALMRTMGAARSTLLWMVMLEGLWLALMGALAGLLLSRLGMALLSSMAEEAYRYSLRAWPPLSSEWGLLAATLLLGLVAAALPAWAAYRTDISETLREGAA